MAAQMVDKRKAEMAGDDSDPDDPLAVNTAEENSDDPLADTTPAISTPAVSASAVSTPVATTTVVSSPAVSTPAVSNPAASTATVSTPVSVKTPLPAPIRMYTKSTSPVVRVVVPPAPPKEKPTIIRVPVNNTDNKRYSTDSAAQSPAKKLKPEEKIRRPSEIYEEFDPKDHKLDEEFRLTKFVEFRARRCKVSTSAIDGLLKGFQTDSTDPAKNGTLGLNMDATILPARHGGLTLLQAQDVVYPCVDDPYQLGRIACASVLSNMYSLGVTEVDNMLMKLCISYHLSEKERDIVVPLMVKGFRDAAKRAGTDVTGGETVTNPWLMLGGVATSVCTSQEYIIPDRCSPGDVLVLTKPLGTQVAMNCYHWMQNPTSWQKIKLVISGPEVIKGYKRAINVMGKLNQGAARLMHKYKAHGATSIGGFGLLGHAMALARCQKNEVSFVIHNLPVIAKMSSVAKAKGNMFQLTQGLTCELSGGLLICLPREQAASFCKDIESTEGSQSWIVGIVEAGNRSARIIDKPRIIEVPSKEREGELW